MREILLLQLNATTAHETQEDLDRFLEQHKAELNFYNETENIILITLDILTFILGLIFNTVVIITFVKHRRAFLTVTNCFLLNLTIADLLVTLICIPAALVRAITDSWRFGLTACKAVHYLQAVAVSNSVFTLTVMSVDRYFAVCHPLERRNLESKKMALLIIFALWTMSIFLFVPIWLTREITGYTILTEDFDFCIEVWSNPIHQQFLGILWFTLVYVVPCIVIGVCYSKIIRTLRQSTLFPGLLGSPVHNSNGSLVTAPLQGCFETSRNVIKERKQISKLVMIITTVFVCCWLPSHLYNLVLDVKADPPEMKYSARFIEMLHQYFVLLGHFTSFLNPLLYSLQTRNFRNHAKSWLCSSCCCKQCQNTERIVQVTELQPVTELRETITEV